LETSMKIHSVSVVLSSKWKQSIINFLVVTVKVWNLLVQRNADVKLVFMTQDFTF
jgi:hypothetical protein